MKDIRQDLKERLVDVDQERVRIQSRLAELTHIESGLKSLLEAEEKRWKPSTETYTLFPPPKPNGSGKYSSPIAQFIMAALSDGKPKTLADLKKGAQLDGIDFGDKKPGRSIHFALVGMQQNSMVEMVGKGVWKLVQGNEKGH